MTPLICGAIKSNPIKYCLGISATSGAVSGAITAACPCMAPALTGVVQGTISAATYAATEKVAYGRNPSVKETLKVGITSGVMAGGIQFIGQKLGAIQCFIAGTLVATKNGLVPIEEIQQGDLVWATDEETGETALKEVVQLFRNETEKWVHVTVNGEEITCTPMHPFYSPVKGWTSAIDLRAGDILVMLNGEYVVVEQVQHELLESSETTYNFEVEDFHTYFVGENSVLVHNKCNGKWTDSGRGSSSNANYHFNKHGSEVGARTLQEYTKKQQISQILCCKKELKEDMFPGQLPIHSDTHLTENMLIWLGMV